MTNSTATVQTPSTTLTFDAHTTAAVAAKIAMRSASSSESAPRDERPLGMREAIDVDIGDVVPRIRGCGESDGGERRERDR